MQEEEDHKEQQRQNFNNMVAEARAEAARNPPPAHDPMRFRAVPPGDPMRGYKTMNTSRGKVDRAVHMYIPTTIFSSSLLRCLAQCGLCPLKMLLLLVV